LSPPAPRKAARASRCRASTSRSVCANFGDRANGIEPRVAHQRPVTVEAARRRALERIEGVVGAAEVRQLPRGIEQSLWIDEVARGHATHRVRARIRVTFIKRERAHKKVVRPRLNTPGKLSVANIPSG
jgi:hypothetical protein